MRTLHFHLPAAMLVATLTACGQGSTPESPAVGRATLMITGRIDRGSFGGPVTAVRAIRGDALVAEAPVGQDGGFALPVPVGVAYAIEIVYRGGSASLVFPRKAGSLDRRFDVTGAGRFDLGAVRRIGDPAAHRYRFSTARVSRGADASGADEGDDLECEDGVDPTTGAECDGGPAASGQDGDED